MIISLQHGKMSSTRILIINMKFKLIICFVFLLSFQFSYAQRDSTLMKFVKHIRAGIDERNEDERRKFGVTSVLSTEGQHLIVLIDKFFVPIDSLYKYNIKDFKSISIELAGPEEIYGSAFKYGMIVLHRKKEEKKK